MSRLESYLLAVLLLASCAQDKQPATLKTFSVVRQQNPNADSGGRLDLYAFRKDDGDMESATCGSGDSISARLVRGREYHLYLLGNCTAFPENIPNEREFLKSRTGLEDNDPDMPLLFSSRIPYKCSDEEMTITLRRYLSRISIGDISCTLPEGIPCKITMLAVMNAAGSIPMSGIPDDNDIRYNLGVTDESLPSEIRDRLIWEGEADIRSSTRIGKSLYALPNGSSADGYGLPWTKRRTRIAVRAILGQSVNWYPVDLPPMECNTDYVINEIVISGPGSSQPDGKVERTSISFDIRVKPWENENLIVDFS